MVQLSGGLSSPSMAWLRRQLSTWRPRYPLRAVAIGVALIYLLSLVGWGPEFKATLSPSSLSESWLPLAAGVSDRSQTLFWHQLFRGLQETRPQIAPIRHSRLVDAKDWEAGTQDPRPDFIKIPSEDETALRASHASYVARLPKLTRLMPYDVGTTGIVTTAGADNFGQVISMLLGKAEPEKNLGLSSSLSGLFGPPEAAIPPVLTTGR